MNISKLSILCVIGILSSAIGGVICNCLKKNMIAAMYEITAGIMSAIVCFDMIPECIKIVNVFMVVVYILIGVALMIFLNIQIDRKNTSKLEYSKTSIMVMLSMGAHNFLEGLAVSSSLMYSYDLGIKVLIAIILHDVPEGIVVGISNKLDKKSNKKVLLNTAISG